MFEKSLQPAFVVLLVSVFIAGCSSRSAEQEFLQEVTDNVIVPGYQAFADSGRALVTVMEAYCHEPQHQDINQPRQQWLQTMGRWQAVQAIGFGPIRENNLTWELQFWPDKKNLVARKNRELLQGDDALTDERIQRASVVVRGLSSLEFLLFDSKAESYGSIERRCDLMQGVSRHLASVAEHLHQQWREKYRAVLLNPGKDNPEYPEAKQAIAVVVDSYLSSLEVMRDRKLAQALGLKTRKQRLNPYMLESWRSQSSRQNVQHNLFAVQQLMQDGGFRTYLASQGQGELADDIGSQLQQLQNILATDEASFFQQLSQQQSETMQSAYTALSPVVSLFKQDVPAALGIQLGFNSNDGD